MPEQAGQFKPLSLWKAALIVVSTGGAWIGTFGRWSTLERLAQNTEQIVIGVLISVATAIAVWGYDKRRHVKFLEQQLDRVGPLKRQRESFNALIERLTAVIADDLDEMWTEDSPKPPEIQQFEIDASRKIVLECTAAVREHLGAAYVADAENRALVQPLRGQERYLARSSLEKWKQYLVDRVKQADQDLRDL